MKTQAKQSLLLLVMVTSIGACSRYSVRKAALVPHMTPTTRSGQAMATNEASLGFSTVANAGAPSEAKGANSGVVIPRVEVNGALRRRLSENLDMGVLWDHGFARGGQKISDDQPAPTNGGVYGGGLTFHYSIPTSNPEFRVGLTADFLAYSVPYVEYRTCIENCPSIGFTTVDEGRNLIPVLSVGIIPSLKKGPWTFFGGFTSRNHPTIEKGAIEGIEGLISDDDEVSAGNFNIVANAGAEVEFEGGVRAMMHIYQTMTTDPVVYTPTVGVGLTLPIP